VSPEEALTNMTTTTTGTISFTGASGRVYSYSLYISDLAGVMWKFSASGNATASTSDFIQLPETVALTDISTVAAPTVSLASAVIKNDLPLGVIIQHANTLNTLTSRMIPHITVNGPCKFQMLQV